MAPEGDTFRSSNNVRTLFKTGEFWRSFSILSIQKPLTSGITAYNPTDTGNTAEIKLLRKSCTTRHTIPNPN